VISRTSTQGYQSEPGNLAEIAKQLGVANILEGSVQKAGNQVRVNVHLVNVQTGSQLWAETYDRKLSDIFSVETEIAKGIAESLQAKLTGREEQALAASHNNPQAYDAYLRGLAFEARAITRAMPFSKPSNFMTWRCGLTRILRSPGRDFLVCTRFFTLTAATQLPLAAMRQRSFGKCAETAAEHARNACSSPVIINIGCCRLRLAKATFGRVSKMLPGNSEVLYALAAIARSEGHWDESIAYWEAGPRPNPRNTALLTEVAFTYAALRQFPKAEKLYDRALDILPNELSLMALKASIYQAEGNLQEAAKLLVQVNANEFGRGRSNQADPMETRTKSEAMRWVQTRQLDCVYFWD
jgi:Predicted integral membrane protein